MAIRVSGADAEHTRRQIRMGRVHPGVVDVHPHTRPVQIAVVRWGGGVGRDKNPRAGQIVGQAAPAIDLNGLHARHLSQRHQAVDRRPDDELRAKRRTLLAQDDRIHRGQGLQRRLTLSGKNEEIQPWVRRQRFLVHRQRQQVRFEFEVRFPGQNDLSLRQRRQLPGGGGAGADEVGVVRHVGNDLRSRLPEQRAISIGQRSARLHHVTARIPVGAQVRRDGQVDRRARIDERVAQQDGLVGAAQFIEALGSVTQPKGKRFVRRVARGIGADRAGHSGRRLTWLASNRRRNGEGIGQGDRLLTGGLLTGGLVTRSLTFRQLPKNGRSQKAEQTEDDPGSRSEVHGVLNHRNRRFR